MLHNLQVLLADRDVLQDQVILVELRNENLLERVQAMTAENSAQQQELEKYIRLVLQVRVRVCHKVHSWCVLSFPV